MAARVATSNAKDGVGANSGDLRRRAWRWHFLAAFLVIPFVLWQSVTGTLYLWSEAYMDARHADMRFVSPLAARATLDAQVATARATELGKRLTGIALPADPSRSTLVTFDDGGLPAAVFVDPYTARVLGALRGADWWPGWTRKLHGGWPLGDPGSWLLELGAVWTIVMVLTGVYLWWPRDGRSIARALLPRLHAGARIFWRDLHACVAVWFSALIVLFLLTALPWTHFWGGSVLKPVQAWLQQGTPSAAGFAPVFASPSRTVDSAHPPSQASHDAASSLPSTPSGTSSSLQTMLGHARAQGLRGDLMFYMVDGPPGSAVRVSNVAARASQERYLLLDRATGDTVGGAQWSDFPLLAKTVATGVDIHEGRFFGAVSPWLNTVFAAALVWLSLTGLMAWWRRKPADALGVPPRAQRAWPLWLRGAAVAMGVALPLLGASAMALWLAEQAWLRVAHAGRA